MQAIVSLMVALTLSSCATLNESMELGAALGTVSGAGATYAAGAAQGHSPSLGTVALGAGIGAGLGIIASYFTHKEVEQTRQSCEADQTQMTFGDLPPSPFILPKTLPKKGSH